mmetsp:Transcript_19341/g.54780  ORF Transcript_19341/g.54780 Transcript_19341/m.54780 type:complete len:81 (+) Transcript_19341:2-244(+)
MEGRIKYFVEVPDPGVLTFTQFTKSNRPMAWKNSDAKIQATLPLLGVADKNGSSIENGTVSNTAKPALVKVILQVSSGSV